MSEYFKKTKGRLHTRMSMFRLLTIILNTEHEEEIPK